MASNLKRQLIFLSLCLTLVLAAVSCNSKSTDDEGEIAVTPALVAVKEFRLAKNDSVMHNLDSVFFSIDLNSGVIFNADSLPKGTKLEKLIAKITFANSMTKADITFRNENNVDTTINYLTNPDDTINFSYPVKLDVTAQDGTNSFSYQIKVNVHKEDPDSIMWDRLATSPLPSRFQNPVAQKTVYREETAYCLIEEYSGKFTLATSSELNKGDWNKSDFSPGFEPAVESFTLNPEGFYLLANNGDLYASPDTYTWTNTGENWVSILGAFGNKVLGIKTNASGFLHSIYPAPESYEGIPVSEDFPIFKSSQMGQIESEWADRPTVFLAGGIMENGKPTSSVWAFDGNNWAVINEDILPALSSPMLARYVVYRDTPYIFLKREFDVWLLFGGTNEDNEMNRKVYLSYDNGVHWTLAPEMMQLSETVPSLAGADLIVADYTLTSDLSEAWTPSPDSRTRASFTIDGYDISWICPYLYIFGGYDTDGALNPDIYRGVLQRLRFVPDI